MNGACAYNSLPRNIRSATDFSMFKSLAKRHFKRFCTESINNSASLCILLVCYFVLIFCYLLISYLTKIFFKLAMLNQISCTNKEKKKDGKIIFF